MYNYKLDKLDFEFLSTNIQNKILLKKIDLVENDQELKLDKDEVNMFLSELSSLLLDIGMKNKEELNEIGYQIERIIDTFNDRLWA